MTPIEPPAGLEPQTDEITRRARRARAIEVMTFAPAAAVVLLALLGLHERAGGYGFSLATVVTASVVLAVCTAIGCLTALAVHRGRLDAGLPLDHGLSPEDRESVRDDIRGCTPSPDPVLRYVEAHTASRLVHRHAHDHWLVPLLVTLVIAKLMTAGPHLLDIAVVAVGCAVVAISLLRSRARLGPAARFLEAEGLVPHPDSCVAFESPSDRRQRLALGTVLAKEDGFDSPPLPSRAASPEEVGAARADVGQDLQDGDTLTR